MLDFYVFKTFIISYIIGVPKLRLCDPEIHLGGGSPLRLNPYPPGGGSLQKLAAEGAFWEIFSGGRARRRRGILEIFSGGKIDFL